MDLDELPAGHRIVPGLPRKLLWILGHGSGPCLPLGCPTGSFSQGPWWRLKPPEWGCPELKPPSYSCPGSSDPKGHAESPEAPSRFQHSSQVPAPPLVPKCHEPCSLRCHGGTLLVKRPLDYASVTLCSPNFRPMGPADGFPCTFLWRLVRQTVGMGRALCPTLRHHKAVLGCGGAGQEAAVKACYGPSLTSILEAGLILFILQERKFK